MSTLKALLKDVPVEWKALEEISDLYNGLTGKNKSDFEDGNAKFVTYKNIYGHIEVNPNVLESVKISPEEKQNEVTYGDILFTGSSENTSDVGVSCAVTIKPDFKLYLNSFSFGLRFKSNFKLIPEFSKYLFRSHVIREQIIKTASGVTRYNVSKKRFLKIQIPIPQPNDPEKSLVLQKEIVRVLDGLSEQNKALTTALAQEIDQRKKQYEYYREELFRFEGKEVEWKTLGEVAEKITSGGTPKTNMPDYYNGNIPWLRTQEVGHGDIYDTEIKITKLGLDNSSAKIIPANCVIVAMYGATVGKVGINKIPLATNQACSNIQLNAEIMLYKFLYYFLKSKYEYIKSLGTGPQTNINAGIIKSLSIPVTSIQEQERIVHLLDQFDEATKNIVAQLEKEIELRNKQYEYYRNELLAFSR